MVVWAADVRELVRRLKPAGCMSRVYIHFPDPWWKERHKKRMVVTETFLGDLSRLLTPDGVVFIQTDVEERAQAYYADLKAHTAYGAPSYLDHNP